MVLSEQERLEASQWMEAWSRSTAEWMRWVRGPSPAGISIGLESFTVVGRTPHWLVGLRSKSCYKREGGEGVSKTPPTTRSQDNKEHS